MMSKDMLLIDTCLVNQQQQPMTTIMTTMATGGGDDDGGGGIAAAVADRHQQMSRWHSPNTRQLCRDRLMSRLKQSHEMRSSLVDRMRKINIRDLDDTDGNGMTVDEDFVDTELEHIIRNDDNMNDISGEELQQLTEEVKQEFLEEQNKSWEGLQTKEDQQKSLKFLNVLQSRHAILCPYCRTYELQLSAGYLTCSSCLIRFETNLSIDEIIQRLYDILNYHQMSGCIDRFPQFNMFQSNLIIYCDTCPLHQCVL